MRDRGRNYRPQIRKADAGVQNEAVHVQRLGTLHARVQLQIRAQYHRAPADHGQLRLGQLQIRSQYDRAPTTERRHASQLRLRDACHRPNQLRLRVTCQLSMPRQRGGKQHVVHVPHVLMYDGKRPRNS